MKKLTLAVEELKVDSFRTEEQGAGGGTVAGHGASELTCVLCEETWVRCPTILTRDCCTP